LPVVSLFPHPASFRFHLTMDTLAFGYILPTTGRIRDFHPLETCAAGRTSNKAAAPDDPGTAAFYCYNDYALSVIPSTASSFLRILATYLSRSSEVNSSSPALKVRVKAMLFIVGGIGTPS